MKLKIFTFLAIAVLTGQANAAWELKQAQLNFVTTKITASHQSVSEVGTFQDVTGQVSDEGEITLQINPLSVNTGVEIRDERLKEWIFAAKEYASIELKSKVSPDVIAKLKESPAGSLETLTTEYTLKIRDKTQTISTVVNLVRDEKEGIYASLTEPLLIDVSNFGLSEGVAKLTDVAKLGLITTQIPVTFSGHFVEK